MRINFMNLVMEQLQSMWRMMARWLCFFSSRPTSVILTRYIIAPDLTTAPTLSVSAVARSWPVRGAKKKTEMPLTCSRPLDEGIMASSYRPWAPCLSSCGTKSCHLMWRGPLWLRQAKHHIALRISLVALTCFACPHNWDAGWWFVEA